MQIKDDVEYVDEVLVGVLILMSRASLEVPMGLHPPLRVAVVALEPGARKLRDYFWAAAHRADELAAARGYPVPPPLPAPSGRGSAAALEPSAAYVEWAKKVREQKTNYVREQLRKGSPARKKVKQARKDARKKGKKEKRK